MPGLKTAAVLIAALEIVLLSACSGSSGNDRQASLQRAGRDLKRSFALRQGRYSGITCLAADNQGNVYAAGFSDRDCVLMKLDGELNTLIKMIRFGSRKDHGYFAQDTIKDMVVDRQGNIFVAGYTDHDDFPVTRGAFDTVISSRGGPLFSEGFVCKFSPSLELMASTFIGGDYEDKAYGIALGPDDAVYITGYTVRSGRRGLFMTTPDAFDRTPAPDYQSKAFVVRLTNDLGTLMAATLLGGNHKKRDGGDRAYDIAIDAAGNVWIAGQTRSDDFPVTRGSNGSGLAGASDAFVAKFDAGLGQLLASTYLGGRNNECAGSIVPDGQGHVFVGGWSESADMLVFLKGYNIRHSRNEADAFIVKMDDRLQNIVSATFLGGSAPAGGKGKPVKGQGDDKLSCMHLSADGRTLYVAGRTESRDFDTIPPSRKQHDGNMVVHIGFDRDGKDPDYGDGFIAAFDTDLSTCISSSLIGGTGLEYIDDILVRGQDLYAAGETDSEDFPQMAINYAINATRGFISRFVLETSGNHALKQPADFRPQFSDEQIKTLAEELSKKHTKHILREEMYPYLGKWAKSMIPREMFEAKMKRAFYLYRKPPLLRVGLDLRFHHYNYFQHAIEDYDVIDLCYAVPSIYAATHTGGRMVLTIIAKNGKWQLADVDFRGFSSETSKRNMQRRLRSR
jgi:hypothetical protein